MLMTAIEQAPSRRRASEPRNDIDIATTALPEEVIRRAKAAGIKSVPTGIEHGTVTLVVDTQPFEVTTLREDTETFGRKAKVAFGRDWPGDAHRRDFTINALSVGIDVVTQAYAATIAKLAAEQKLPTAYPAREFVELGGLLSYGVDYPDLYYRAAGLIDKIFKGARPANLPVEQPTKLELVINLKAAKALGFDVPPALLARADEVVE